MLWLAHHHFTDEQPLNFTFLSQAFAINETVYIMYMVSSGKEGFPVYRLNPASLDVQKINVAYKNFNPPSSLSGCIVVDKKRVVIWNARDRVLYEGLEVDNGLSFRVIRTMGDLPHQIFGFAFCMYKESLIIYGGLTFENITSTDTYELNLNTFVWSRRQTKATQAKGTTAIKSQLSVILECFDADNLVVGDRMHIIGHSVKSHFVLNLTTNVWKRVSIIEGPEMPSYSNKFVSASQLFAYGRKEPNEPRILYRFDEKKEKWKEVLSSLSHRLPRRFEHVAVAGSRVYFMKDANLGIQVTTLVSVLKTNPTIFQRSAPSLRSSRFGRSIVKKFYPNSVNDQIGQNEETRKQCQLSHIF